MTNDGDNQGRFSLSINGQFYGGQREMHIIISEKSLGRTTMYI